MTEELWRRGAVELAGMIAEGSVSAREVVDAHLERIEGTLCVDIDPSFREPCERPVGATPPWSDAVVAAVGRLVRRVSRDDRADVADGGRFVRGHAGAEQAGDGDGSDDADDRHDDQQFDESETLLTLHSFLKTPSGGGPTAA